MTALAWRRSTPRSSASRCRSVTIPITPGRNLAVILEVAAMNNRQKRMGYNAAVEFTEQMSRFFENKNQ